MTIKVIKTESSSYKIANIFESIECIWYGEHEWNLEKNLMDPTDWCSCAVRATIKECLK